MRVDEGTAWLLLVERIGTLREPAALPGGLAATAQRECFRLRRVARRHERAELPRWPAAPLSAGG